MKKWLCLLLAGALTFSLAACHRDQNPDTLPTESTGAKQADSTGTVQTESTETAQNENTGATQPNNKEETQPDNKEEKEKVKAETLSQCDSSIVEKKEETPVRVENYENGVKKEVIADTPKHKEFRVTYPNGYYKYKMLMK